MVARTSERMDSPGRNVPQVSTQGLGAAPVQNKRGAFSTHVNLAESHLRGTPVAKENPVLAALLGVAKKGVDAWIETERQEAHLQGSADRLAGVAEEDMETNFFTHSWSVAGHRDTSGMLAIANYEAGLLSEMGKMREMAPSEAAKFISAKRKELQPTIAAMSREGRQKTFSQLLSIDNTIIRKQATEHQKYIVDQMTKAISVSASVALDMVTATKDDPPAHLAAQENFVVWYAENVLNNPNLPPDVKEEILVDSMTQGMRDGNLELYNLGRQLKVGKTEGGRDMTLVNTLSFENQIKLSKAYEQGKNLNEAQTSQTWWGNTTDMEMSQVDGRAYSYDTYAQHVDQGVQKGFISPSSAMSMKLSYAKSMADTEAAANMVSAYESGNYDVMARSGMTFEKVTTTVEAQWVQANPELTANDIALRHLEISTRTGNPSAQKRAGVLIQPSIGALMTSKSEEVDPSSAQIITQMFSLVDAAEERGFTMSRANVLSALDPAQSSFVSMVMENHRIKGLDPVDAIQSAREAMRRAESMSPAHKQEHMRAQSAVDSKILQKASDPNTFWNQLWRAPAAMLGIGDAATYQGVRPESDGSDSTVTAIRQSLTQYAVGEELQAINNTGLVLSEDAKEKDAVGRVLNRLIPTEGSSLILPRGTNMNSMFGLEPSYNRENIGKALEKAAYREGLIPVYQMQEGTVRVDYYNDRGDTTPVAVTHFDPKGIGQVAKELRREADVKANTEYGTGTTVKGPNGAEVTYNGDNSARVPNTIAKQVRDTLVKFEGVRNQAYADGSGGKQSIGVGVNSSNPDVFKTIEVVNGVASNSSISSSFMSASNFAMTKAVNTLESAGMYDPNNVHLISLMTNLIYQRPATTEEHGEPLLRAIRDGNRAEAVRVVKETTAYKHAGDNRKKFYTEAAWAAASK